MFRFFNFRIINNVNWANNSSVKKKQNNCIISIKNNKSLLSSYSKQKEDDKDSKSKYNCHNRMDYDAHGYHFGEDIGLGVGAAGTVHYFLNHWDSTSKDIYCPIQYLKNLSKHFINNIIFIKRDFAITLISFNVFPKSNFPSGKVGDLNNHEVNIASDVGTADAFSDDCNDAINDNHNDAIITDNDYLEIQFDDILTQRDLLVVRDIKNNVEKERIIDALPKPSEKINRVPDLDASMDELKRIYLNIRSRCENTMAVKLAKKRIYEKSIMIWKHIVKTNPSFLEAKFNLAVCYQEGFGTSKDIEKASVLYKELITAGHVTSLYNMAVILLNNAPSNESRELAYKFLNRASNKGLVQATDALIKLSLDNVCIRDDNLQINTRTNTDELTLNHSLEANINAARRNNHTTQRTTKNTLINDALSTSALPSSNYSETSGLLNSAITSASQIPSSLQTSNTPLVTSNYSETSGLFNSAITSTLVLPSSLQTSNTRDHTPPVTSNNVVTLEPLNSHIPSTLAPRSFLQTLNALNYLPSAASNYAETSGLLGKETYAADVSSYSSEEFNRLIGNCKEGKELSRDSDACASSLADKNDAPSASDDDSVVFSSSLQDTASSDELSKSELCSEVNRHSECSSLSVSQLHVSEFCKKKLFADLTRQMSLPFITNHDLHYIPDQGRSPYFTDLIKGSSLTYITDACFKTDLEKQNLSRESIGQQNTFFVVDEHFNGLVTCQNIIDSRPHIQLPSIASKNNSRHLRSLENKEFLRRENANSLSNDSVHYYKLDKQYLPEGTFGNYSSEKWLARL